jgi:hypothetical protein
MNIDWKKSTTTKSPNSLECNILTIFFNKAQYFFLFGNVFWKKIAANMSFCYHRWIRKLFLFITELNDPEQLCLVSMKPLKIVPKARRLTRIISTDFSLQETISNWFILSVMTNRSIWAKNATPNCYICQRSENEMIFEIYYDFIILTNFFFFFQTRLKILPVLARELRS